MSKVTAINEIIEKKNLLRKCQEKHATSVNIDAILFTPFSCTTIHPLVVRLYTF